MTGPESTGDANNGAAADRWRSMSGLHRLISGFSGRLPGPLVAQARDWLGREDLVGIVEVLVSAVIALDLSVTPPEAESLAALPAAPGRRPSLPPELRISDAGPPALPSFRAGAPADQTDRAAVNAVFRDPKVIVIHRSTRTGADGDHRVRLVEAGPGARVWRLAADAQHALEARGVQAPQVEAYWTGDAPNRLPAGRLGRVAGAVDASRSARSRAFAVRRGARPAGLRQGDRVVRVDRGGLGNDDPAAPAAPAAGRVPTRRTADRAAAHAGRGRAGSVRCRPHRRAGRLRPRADRAGGRPATRDPTPDRGTRTGPDLPGPGAGQPRPSTGSPVRRWPRSRRRSGRRTDRGAVHGRTTGRAAGVARLARHRALIRAHLLDRGGTRAGRLGCRLRRAAGPGAGRRRLRRGVLERRGAARLPAGRAGDRGPIVGRHHG